MQFSDDTNAHLRRQTGDDVDALHAFLETIATALTRRDHGALHSLLRQRLASHLPREIREELLLVAAQPAAGFRVAIEFLRYRHRMRQLANGGEPIPQAQLELALGVGAGRESGRERWLAESANEDWEVDESA